MRLFLGLPIPLDLAQDLIRAAHSLRLPEVRWSKPENIHLTLSFLGEVAETKIPAITEQLKLIHAPSLRLHLTSFGTFPHAGILLAVVDLDAELIKLQSQVATRMARCSFAPEERPYRPHLTLARSRSLIRLDRKSTKLPAQIGRSFEITAVHLYRSDPTPSGSRYTVLATCNLDSGSPPAGQLSSN